MGGAVVGQALGLAHIPHFKAQALPSSSSLASPGSWATVLRTSGSSA